MKPNLSQQNKMNWKRAEKHDKEEHVSGEHSKVVH